MVRMSGKGILTERSLGERVVIRSQEFSKVIWSWRSGKIMRR